MTRISGRRGRSGAASDRARDHDVDPDREDARQRVRRQARVLLVACLVTILAALAGMALGQTDLGRDLERKTYDMRFLARNNPALAPLGLFAPPRVDPRVVVIGIDRRTYRKIQLPTILWNPFHAVIIRQLGASGARAVGLDLIQDNSREGLAPGGNQALAEALAEAARVVLVYPVGPAETGIHRSGTPIDPTESAGPAPGIPIPPYFARVVGPPRLALMNLSVEPDGVIRRHPLFRGVDLDADGTVLSSPTLAFTLLQLHEQATVDPQDVRPGRPFRLGSLVIPWDEEFRIDINFAGAGGQESDGRGRTFRYLSYADVLERAQRADRAWFRQNFSDRIVLLGESDPLINGDLKMTPFFGARRELMPGVEVHANILNTVLTGAYLRQLPAGQALALGLATAGAIAAGVLWLSPGWAAPWLVALLALQGWGALRAFSGEGLLVPMVGPQAAGLVAAIASLMLRVLVLDRDARTKQSIFERYVSPEIAHRIFRNPDRVTLTGEQIEATVLFSDINDFTTMSRVQKTEPRRIIELLNEYYEVMVPVAMEHQATLQSFQGDGMMILFNAPVRQPDHELRAVRTAIAMLRALLAWQQQRAEQGLETFWMKIGINTGSVVAGTVGSKVRLEYSVIGDTTNMASRIMGVAKQRKCDILIGEKTWARVKDHIECLEPAEVEVKGISEKIRVYPVVWWEGADRPDSLPPEAAARPQSSSESPVQRR